MTEMFYYVLCLAPCLALVLGAQQVPLTDMTSSPFTASFDKLVSQNLDRWHTPGLAVAVIDGEDTFSKGYGMATFPDKPMTPENLFYTASTTKSFTAAAVSLLINDSVNSSASLSWQVPLATVMREDFVLADEYATAHVTIEDALSHRTGMPRHDFTYGGPNVTVRDVVRNLRHLPLTAEIRTTFQYCNMMYIVISHFIETWTGMWLGDFLKKRIYEPLSMSSTFFSLSDAKKAGATGGPSLATPYYWTNKTKSYHPIPWLDAPQESGCGAMISNVLDYTKWLRCMMTECTVLSLAGHDALRSPRTINRPLAEQQTGFRGVEAYALGWDVSNYRGEVMIWYTGGLPGFNSVMMYFPRLQWGLTVMANGGEGGAIQVLIFKLVDDRLGIPEHERFNWIPVMELHEISEQETLKNAKHLLYPNAPKGRGSIPPSLPLDSYAGTYTNEGYPSLTLTFNGTSPSHTASEPETTLHCFLQFEQYPISISFLHISADYFLLYLRWFSTEGRHGPNDIEPATDGISKAEFRLGEDGHVKELGILLESEMGEDKIWFKKVGAEDGVKHEKSSRSASSAAKMENKQSPDDAGRTRRLFSRSRVLAPLFA